MRQFEVTACSSKGLNAVVTAVSDFVAQRCEFSFDLHYFLLSRVAVAYNYLVVRQFEVVAYCGKGPCSKGHPAAQVQVALILRWM